MASSFGTLASLDLRLHPIFDVGRMSLADVEHVMDDYVDAVETGRATAEGWPDWINPASKVGQVAAIQVLARELAGEAARRDILVTAACPGLVDTGASRPWFDDMSGALAPDDVLWLATLPVGVRECRQPHGNQHESHCPGPVPKAEDRRGRCLGGWLVVRMSGSSSGG